MLTHALAAVVQWCFGCGSITAVLLAQGLWRRAVVGGGNWCLCENRIASPVEETCEAAQLRVLIVTVVTLYTMSVTTY